MPSDGTIRIDKLLWFLRLAESRGFAQHWVLAGHIRLNGQRITKPSAPVAPGDVLTLPMRTRVQAVEVLMLPARRGPAPEARACYRALDEHGENPIAASDNTTPEGNSPP
jgi:ribosome-associated heat shock protein Hsp15